MEEFFRGKDGSVSPVETGLGQLPGPQLDVVNLGVPEGADPTFRRDGTQLGEFHLSCVHQWLQTTQAIGARLMESGKEVGAIAPGGVGSWGHSPEDLWVSQSPLSFRFS